MQEHVRRAALAREIATHTALLTNEFENPVASQKIIWNIRQKNNCMHREEHKIFNGKANSGWGGRTHSPGGASKVPDVKPQAIGRGISDHSRPSHVARILPVYLPEHKHEQTNQW